MNAAIGWFCAGMAAGFLCGYVACWADDANRHIYTNCTVSAEAARTPRTPPSERSPATTDEPNGGGDGRQRAAGWFGWLNKPAEFWICFAAAMAVAFWSLLEIYDRPRTSSKRGGCNYSIDYPRMGANSIDTETKGNRPMKPPTVMFVEIDKFIAEAQRDTNDESAADWKPLARVTALRQRPDTFACYFYVAAGYINPRGELVELRRYVGDAHVAFPNAPPGSRERALLDDLNSNIDHVREQLELLGFDVRAGLFTFTQWGNERPPAGGLL